MTRLRERYQKVVVPQLREALGVTNVHALPHLVKVSVNVGMGKILKDPAIQQTVVSTLERVTGQKPVLTKARLSIAAFKLREGMVIGAKVTLRGPRMEEFLDKLINITLPRVRDFRGLDPKSVVRGTMTIGLKEHNVFPEIRSDEVERLHGLEVTIVTTGTTREATLAFLKALGMPFHDGRVSEPKTRRPKRERKEKPATK